MVCDPKCHKTASLDGPGGNRIMISQPGNKKFPIPYSPHPQCEQCSREEYESIMEKVVFEGHEDLLEKFKKIKGKLEGHL